MKRGLSIVGREGKLRRRGGGRDLILFARRARALLPYHSHLRRAGRQIASVILFPMDKCTAL